MGVVVVSFVDVGVVMVVGYDDDGGEVIFESVVDV